MSHETRRQELLDLLFNVNPEYKGYGPMSDATRQLLAEDFIDVETGADGHWFAKLTPKGEKRKAMMERD